MAELLRRILWLVPVLVAGALVIFLAIGTTSQVRSHLRRPLFYNPTPISAQVAAREALEKAKRGETGGAASLSVLGGAALPVILEELPSLSVSEQRHLVQGLERVAARMRLREEGSWSASTFSERAVNDNGDDALLFWERYREEHALDLRPLATTRLVKRAAQRNSQTQNADLLAVDTYALPFLVGALGRISQPNDVAHARRVVRAISHATGKKFVIPPEATPDDARKVVSEIRNFWDEEGAKWTQLGRSELLVARFSQTEFASWVFRSVRQLTGLDHPALWDRFVRLGRRSVSLALASLFGLLFVGPTLAATVQVLALRRTRWQLERWSLRAALAASLVTLTPLIASPGESTLSELSLLGLVTGTAFSAFILQRELNDRLDWRTHHVLKGRPGLRKIGAVFRWLAPSVPTLTPLAVAEAALWVTCLEAGAKSEGLGSGALRAYAGGDLDFLMALCLGLGLATGILQILADVLLGPARVQQGES